MTASPQHQALSEKGGFSHRGLTAASLVALLAESPCHVTKVAHFATKVYAREAA